MGGKKDKKDKKDKKKGLGQFADETRTAFVNTVPKGDKKDFSKEMTAAYHPDEVEATWNDWWCGKDLYKPSMDDDKKEKFVIVIPPPNVTGTLHLGHALTCAVQDCIVRWNRMCGKNTLWVPGTDHAGIATQVVVEKKLQREQQLTRYDLGREKFLEQVWKWKEENGNRICDQLRRLGASVDWEREAFTMDSNLSEAVQEAFVVMRKKGLIYRAHRLVNWSCALKSAISKIEVDKIDITKPTFLKVPGHEKKVEFGVIHSFAYKIKGSDEEIVVATTRIETMLGDVAVAVHPEDDRYKHLHGKTLIHPFLPEREVKLITDAELVKMEFGTGAVKVTPAHDPEDFKCGTRNKLRFINIFTDEGLMNEHCAMFTGMKRFEAREKVIEEMQKLGIYRGKDTNAMQVPICSRSKDVIEPVIRPQWWVNCKGMAKRSIDAVRNGDLEIIPADHKKTWYGWLEDIHEWCISRQLWWGHRIPAYIVSIDGQKCDDDDKNWIVAKTEAEALELAAKQFKVDKKRITVTQDEDVLDTWFSSGLFPFSVMGWPRQTPDLEKFFPGELLETGHDILFFWVARMVMMSLCLTDKLPFKKVYLHSMVRDKEGRKMSKSLGNVVDPLDVIEGINLEDLHDKLRVGNLAPAEVEKAVQGQKNQFPDGIATCGTDALRFGLLAYLNQGGDINLDINRVVSYRQFCNKLWNATKFALSNFDATYQPPRSLKEVEKLVSASGRISDRWMLSKLARAIEGMNTALKNYRFAEASSCIHNFFLHHLCDVYLEVIKPVMYGKEADKVDKLSVQGVLYIAIEYGLKLLHPLMPFVTEELFHRLPMHAARTKEIQKADPTSKLATGSLMIQQYPTIEESSHLISEGDESTIEKAMAICAYLRSSKVSMNIPNKKTDVFFRCSEENSKSVINSCKLEISSLAYCGEIVAGDESLAVPDGAVTVPCGGTLMGYLPVKGLIDNLAECTKVQKKLKKIETLRDDVIEKMSAGTYQEKTPPATKQAHADKITGYQAECDKFSEAISEFLSNMTAEEQGGFKEYLVEEVHDDIKNFEKANGKVMKKVGAGKPNKKQQDSLDANNAKIDALKVKVEAMKAGNSTSSVSSPTKSVSATPVATTKVSFPLKAGSVTFESLSDVNTQLGTSSYVGGNLPSSADVCVFEALGGLGECFDAVQTPHVSRWHSHMNSFSAAERARW